MCAGRWRGRLRPVIRRPGLPIAQSAGAPAWSSSGLSAPSIGKSTTASFAAPARAALPPAQRRLPVGLEAGARDPGAVPDDGDARPGPASRPDRRRHGLQEHRLRELVVGVDLQARRVLLRRHLRPGESEAARVRAGAHRPVPRRGRARDHAEHPGRLPGRRPGGQQRSRARARAGASTSTTSPTRPSRRRSCSRFGDRSPDPLRTRPFAPTDAEPQTPNSSHSVFIWQDGDKAYLVATDNTEFCGRRHLRHHGADRAGVHRRR